MDISRLALNRFRSRSKRSRRRPHLWRGEPIEFVAQPFPRKRATNSNFYTTPRDTNPPLPVLQELGGWQVLEMMLEYADLASEHLAPYVDRMSGLRLVQDEKVATFSATGTQ